MLADLSKPIIFAHRGASAHAPENTLASFELALQQGADAIELDVRLTADEQIVVFHDRTLERTTDGSGRVLLKTLAELRELDAGSSFSPAYKGAQIPLLEEVFEAVGRKLFMNLEFKNYAAVGDNLVLRVCELVRKCALQQRVLFSSFLPQNLSRAKQLLPEVDRGLLAAERWKGSWARSFAFAFGDYAVLHCALKDADAREVQRVHRLRRRILVWTVNKPEDMRRLVACGTDGLFTDDPALALQTIGRSA